LAAALLLIAAGAGSYVVVSAGGGAGATPTQEPSTATATATAERTAETPAASATATSPPPTSQPSSEPSATSGPIHPGVTCPDGEPRYHLNIQKFQDELRQYPTFQDAVVTEADLDTVSVVVQDAEFLIDGWGELVVVGGYGSADTEVHTQLIAALDAVRYEC
jgi:hypothetical protein